MDNSFGDWTGDGLWGRWEDDEDRLPSYRYDPDFSSIPRMPETTEKALAHSPWHQIGNDRITASAHDAGHLQLYNSDRGLCCHTPYEPVLGCFGGGAGAISFHGEAPRALRRDLLPGGARMELRFGMGYARYRFDIRGARIELTHWCHDCGLPAVITDISIRPGREIREPFAFHLVHSIACWFIDFDPICSGWRRERFGESRILKILSLYARYLLYPLRLTTNMRRMRYARSFNYMISRDALGAVIVAPLHRHGGSFDPALPARRQRHPLPFFSISEGGRDVHIVPAEDCCAPDGLTRAFSPRHIYTGGERSYRRPIALLHSFSINPGGRNRFRVIWGCGGPADISEAHRLLSRCDMREGLRESRERAFHFSLPGLPWVKREWRWHGDYLRRAAMYDRYYESRTVRQGSAYYYIQGVDGAPRDHALFAAALAYLDPPLAREIIVTMLRGTHPDGRLPYALYGYGKSSGFGLHSVSSDLYLFFLWAVCEYVFTARDFGFLDEAHPYYPRRLGNTRTVREQISQSCRYLIDVLGTGEHGLIRSGTGDWNDFIQFHATNRRLYVKKGESVYNTAMALYVLPHAARLLGLWDEEGSARLLEFSARLGKALRAQWNGKWLVRSYDGAGRAIGDDRLFLEHSAWALVAGCLPNQQRDALVRRIRESLDLPSPIGAGILSPPARLRFNMVPPGWDTNGGVWPAANALLSWGYGKSNASFARESLLRNSLCAHAQSYPRVWYGIWSGPDSYNAHYAKNPGETFYHLTPMADYPVMNSNAHASPLLAAIKLCGMEPDLDGFHIRPMLPDGSFALSTPHISLQKTPRALSFCYRAQAGIKPAGIDFTVEDPLCARGKPALSSRGLPLRYTRESRTRIRFTQALRPGMEISWRLESPSP